MTDRDRDAGRREKLNNHHSQPRSTNAERFEERDKKRLTGQSPSTPMTCEGKKRARERGQRHSQRPASVKGAAIEEPLGSESARCEGEEVNLNSRRKSRSRKPQKRGCETHIGP